MPKRKKSRKVGLIGVRSVPKDERQRPAPTERVRKKKGKPAGNKQTEGQTKKNQQAVKRAPADPRVGSKKPVSLTATTASRTNKPAKPKFFSPQQELDAIENDSRLDSLLDKLDAGKRISAEEQAYVDGRLKRHKQLCQLLGINPEEEQSAQQQEPDLLAKFERSNLDEFK